MKSGMEPTGVELPDAPVIASTAKAMRALGQGIARHLRTGDLVVLSGGLGAGKTTLTQGIAAGLGVRGPITSPTFVIARVHPSLGDGPSLVHVDAFRLGSLAEVDDLDLDTSMEDAVTVVEWGGGKSEQLSADRLEVVIEAAGAEARTVALRRIGERWLGSPLRGATSEKK